MVNYVSIYPANKEMIVHSIASLKRHDLPPQPPKLLGNVLSDILTPPPRKGDPESAEVTSAHTKPANVYKRTNARRHLVPVYTHHGGAILTRTNQDIQPIITHGEGVGIQSDDVIKVRRHSAD